MVGERALNHLTKYKDFYERQGLKFAVDPRGIPTPICICCFCGASKETKNACGKTCCRTGQECEQYVPDNARLQRHASLPAASLIDPGSADYERDYFKPAKSEQELKIEELENRIKDLERLATLENP